MTNYSKWDSIVDSEEEDEKRTENLQSMYREDQSMLRDDQAKVESWLRRQEAVIHRGDDKAQNKAAPTFPEMVEQQVAERPVRRLTKEERKVVAMLISVSHFEEGETNLDRHPQLLDLVRHNRFLEEDPGTLELLCRIYNYSMRFSGYDKKGPREEELKIMKSDEEHRMRSMILSGINTIAAPKQANFPGGLLEMISTICTPDTSKARQERMKWQKKEFAKDAIFDCLFPDLRAGAEEGDSGMDAWLFALLIMLLLVGCFFLFYIWYGSTSAKNDSVRAAAQAASMATLEDLMAAGRNMTAAPLAQAAAEATVHIVDTATGMVGSAAAAAGAASAAAWSSDSADAAAAAMAQKNREIEELQRQIEELKRGKVAAGAGGAVAEVTERPGATEL